MTRVVNGTIEILSQTIPTKANGSVETCNKTSGTTSFPQNRTKQKKNDIPFCSLPGKHSLVALVKLAGPIFFVMMSKIACYSIMTVRATNLGIVPLASHNIMMRVFFFFSCFGDSLSQAAQTFIPQVALRDRGRLAKRLFYLSTIIGFCISQVSSRLLSNLGRFLTKDASIIGLMKEFAPYVGLATLLHPFTMLLEGSLLANRDLIFLVGMYISIMVLHFSFVFSSISSSFGGLWRAFFVFQATRLLHVGVRTWFRSRNEVEKNATLLETA